MTRDFDVMVIDDEQVVLDAVKRICGAEDYAVDTSLEVNAALNKIMKNRYGLILCDLMLPDIDGFRFLEMLNEKGIEVPVIMTTGFSTMENAVKSLGKGAIDFIPKPFTADELSSAIIRGLKYIEINEADKNRNGGVISFVPCPPKYYRLGYTTWISRDKNGAFLVGATDLFLKTVQSVKKIELLRAREEIVQGSYCATLISHDEMSHPILGPLSGRIINHNSRIIENPSLLEKDPYFDGWLYRIIPSDFDYEIKNLISCRVAL